MTYPEHLSPVERDIIDCIVKKALDVGCSISIFDGEDHTIRRSRDHAAISKVVAATEITVLNFFDDVDALMGSIILLHGNEEDVIHDCTDKPFIQELIQHGMGARA